MGVGGNFWDLLKPYARHEGVDFLRDKRVAIDLSFWIVQHETAVSRAGNARSRSPHLRVTFFRTINLFAKMGAFPVFVVDGEPSPLKSRARIERFFRATGVDLSASPGLPRLEEGVSVKRNRTFTRYVDECVELLELLGMPIIRARCEAEALCAQLNSEGHVDACITSDSDALLFGAKSVIKCLRSNSKEPFECYNITDVESGLGLKRKQLIAISLLVGNDHDLNGVTGIGVDTAVRFVQLFSEDEVLDRLSEIGNGDSVLQLQSKTPLDCLVSSSDESSPLKRTLHCSNCGHPGSRKAHIKIACDSCFTYGNENCITKPAGFKCKCSACDEGHRCKEQRKFENWKIKVCQKISDEPEFPNKEIIDMYLSSNNGSYHENDGPHLLWENPRVDSLVDFLVYHLHWEPSYIRQRILPMLSTIFLRDMALNPVDDILLLGQYEFHSIHRVKIRYSHPYYVVKWKRVQPTMTCLFDKMPNEQSDRLQNGTLEAIDITDTNLLDEEDAPEILVDDGSCFLVTDENMGLVQAAFPKEVRSFLQEKELKESIKRRKSTGDKKSPETPKSSGIQLSITQFYRTTKTRVPANSDEEQPKAPRKGRHEKKEKPSSEDLDRNFSRSVRRRLLFD